MQKDDIKIHAMCIGKAKHESFAAASAQLKKGKSRPDGSHKGRKLQVYSCEFCGFWHIGHGKPKPKG